MTQPISTKPEDQIFIGTNPGYDLDAVRTQMMYAYPYMSGALMSAPLIEVPKNNDIKWGATDGLVVYHNPENMKEMAPLFAPFMYMHEIAHKLFGHPFMLRTEEKKHFNMKVFSYAVECVANYWSKIWLQCNVPSFLVYDPKYDGMTEWEIYREIMSDEEERERVEKIMKPKMRIIIRKKGEGDNGGEGEGDFEVIIEGADGEGEEVLPGHEKWGTLDPDTEQRVREEAGGILAEIAREMEKNNSQGHAAGNLKRMVELLLDRTPWEDILAKYLQHSTVIDYSWSVPDKRSHHLGVVLPGMREVQGDMEAKKLFVAIDTSGSVDNQMLAKALSSIRTLVEELGGYESWLAYCDAAVHGVSPLKEWKDSIPGGGGGTSFVPIFDYIEKELKDDISVLIYLTDGMGSFPSKPNYDVVWLDFGPGVDYPFGEVVKFKI